MVKHTQTIPQFADALFECVWPFCETGAYRVSRFGKCPEKLTVTSWYAHVRHKVSKFTKSNSPSRVFLTFFKLYK